MLGLRVVMALRTSRVVLGAGGALKALGVASGDAALGPPLLGSGCLPSQGQQCYRVPHP